MNAKVQPVAFEKHSALPLVSGFSACLQDIECLNGRTVYHVKGHHSDHLLAYAAESLLMMPEAGDLILCGMSEE